MCVVIDANVLSKVFDTNNTQHDNFKPVYDWILFGKGKVVYGGSKYLDELKKMGRYLNLIRQLKDAKLAVKRETQKVDNEHREVKKLNDDKNFNDEHLIGIIRESKCKLLCSDDTSAFPYIKDPKYYRSGSNRPSIYSQKSNESLLNEKYIASCCKPVKATTRTARSQISDL